ncbi:hypothetical protein M2266_006329 [Streptomyces sp. SPB162]|nr:hypothetical protein [Streptomyces sp. SPB162]
MPTSVTGRLSGAAALSSGPWPANGEWLHPTPGFVNPRRFSRAFPAAYGTTPREGQGHGRPGAHYGNTAGAPMDK